MGQDAAAKKGTELLLDEAGSGLLCASRACEEVLDILPYDLVEQGCLGLVALILDGGVPSRDRVLGGDPSKFGAAGRSAVARQGGPTSQFLPERA